MFRWSPPAVGRCNVGSYRINCWQEKNGVKTSICNGVEVPGHVLEYKRTGLSEKQMYYFTVSAISSVGSGPTTAMVNVSTTKEMPVPLLLIFTNDTFWLADVDTQTLGSQQSGKAQSSISFERIFFKKNVVKCRQKRKRSIVTSAGCFVHQS